MSQTRIDELQACISSGEAFPAMSQDIQQARELNVRASPTLIFYEDRQHLTGNVGYRIMQYQYTRATQQPDWTVSVMVLNKT